MKILHKLMMMIALVTLFASCESNSNQTKLLSDNKNRRAIMDSIATDSTMSKEMLGMMMNSKNNKLMQQHVMRNQNAMIKMLNDNPAMMQSMMDAMMETTKRDTSRMYEIIETMSENPEMFKMMQNMSGKNRVNGMRHMGGMNN